MRAPGQGARLASVDLRLAVVARVSPVLVQRQLSKHRVAREAQTVYRDVEAVGGAVVRETHELFVSAAVGLELATLALALGLRPPGIGFAVLGDQR